MAQNESTPSVKCVSCIQGIGVKGLCLTDSSHNLGFQSKLVLEASCNVAYAAMAISNNVWDFPNMVEHMTTNEQENGNQADGSPNIAILDDRQHISGSTSQRSADAEDNGDSRGPSKPVEGSLHRRVRSIGKLPRDPGMNLLSCGRPEIGQYRMKYVTTGNSHCYLPCREIVSHRLWRGSGMGSNRRVE